MVVFGRIREVDRSTDRHLGRPRDRPLPAPASIPREPQRGQGTRCWNRLAQDLTAGGAVNESLFER
ncbi:MAG: hypothetical protein QOF01_2601 [Thermomicrobiales bacterium]|nr:hypothetical protein [Thermomicrobiales bacterium]